MVSIAPPRAANIGAAAWGGAAAALAAIAGVAVTRSPGVALGLLACFVGVLGLAVVQQKWLGYFTLATFVLLPFESLPFRVPGGVLPVAVIAFIAWWIREPSRPTPLLIRLSGCAVIVVIAGSFVAAQEHSLAVLMTSLAMSLPGLVLVRTPAKMIPGWGVAVGWVVPLLGLYAGLEKLLRDNPLYGGLYARADPPIEQIWSVYRATTTFGHPLHNGTVFATFLVLTTGLFIARRLSPSMAMFAMFGAAVGLWASVSRGATYAAIVCMLILLVTGKPDAAFRGGWRRFVMIVALVCAGLFASAALVERSATDEGRASSAARSELVSNTRAAASGHPWFGVGPGLGEKYRRETNQPGVGDGGVNGYLSLESAYAQRAVDTGYLGLATFVVALFLVVGSSFRASDTRAAGVALLAFMGAIAGYNGTSAGLGLYVLAACLMLAALQGQARHPAHS